MDSKQHCFNNYYNQTISQIKWFEPFVDPVILKEFKDSEIKKDMHVLDVGCGCSLDSIFFAYNGLNVTSVDFASKAIDKLDCLAKIIGVKINTLNSSIFSLSSKYDGLFDFVSDNGCFHHIKPCDRSNYVDQIYRVLKPSGTLFLRAHAEVESLLLDSRELRAYRLSSDEIIKTFFQKFLIEKMYPYNYIKSSDDSKVWFVRLKKRNCEVLS